MTSEQKVNQVHQYIAALNQHDADIIDALFSDDATIEDPVGSKPRRGKAEIAAMYQQAFAMQIRAELTGNVRLAANFAVFPFRFVFKPGDDWTEIEAIDQFEFDEEGRVRSMKAYWGPDNLITPA